MHESRGSNFLRRSAPVAGLGMVAALLLACVSAPMAPPASLTAAKDAIANAERSDARQYAGAELEEASQKLEGAESAVDSERMEEAERLSQQSRIAAELAMARTASAKAAEINREMGRGADALDEEMKRVGEQR